MDVRWLTADEQELEAAIEELDYVPNRTARSLRRQYSDVIALIIPDVENPFFTSVARGVEEIWTDHVALAFEINGFETVPEIIRAVHGDDPVLVTRYSVLLSGIRSEIEFCLPLTVIDRFLLDSRDRRIESNAGSAEERRLNRMYAEETTLRVRVEVSARVPEMRLSIDHLSSIRPGVVLDTGVKVDAALELRVRDQVRFVGRATQVDDRLAIEVDNARAPDRARLRQISATNRDRSKR